MGDKRNPPPKIDDNTIRELIGRLLAAAPPGSKVILFGSQARGDADAHSDVDLMVIEPDVNDMIAEYARLTQTLRHEHVPFDLLVVSQAEFDYWRETRNTVYYRAVHEGKLYESLP